METQWYHGSTGDGARGASVEVASANRTPDFRAKAPDVTAKTVEHKRYRELSNLVGAEFRMRNRFRVRIQKELSTQPHEGFWTEYRSDISCHPFGSCGRCATRRKPVQKQGMPVVRTMRAATAAATAAVRVRTENSGALHYTPAGGHTKKIADHPSRPLTATKKY